MDKLTFFASLAKSLAWPVAAFGIALVCRNDLAEVLGRVKRIKHKDTEIDFSAKLGKVRADANESLPPSGESQTETSRKTEKLAELSPRGAILEAWLEVEAALYEMAKRYGVVENEARSLDINMLRIQLSDYNPMGLGAYEMLDKLRHLRNEAVHLQDKDIDPAAAIEYSNLAKRMVSLLDEA